jgi:hypothetical protein
MKKLTLSIIIMIVSLFTFSGSSFAATHTIENQTISHVEFDSIAHAYFIVTEPTKKDSGEWCLYLLPSTNPTLEKPLTDSLKGFSVWIEWDDHNSLNSDYWEVLNWDYIDVK